MTYCLFNFAGQSAGCIADYIIYGIILFVIGLLLAIFIPIGIGRKIGLILLSAGIILGVGFPLIINLWINYIMFKVLVISIIVFIIIYFVLFSDKKITKRIK